MSMIAGFISRPY